MTRPAVMMCLCALAACGGTQGAPDLSGATSGLTSTPSSLCAWFTNPPNKHGDCPVLVTDLPAYDRAKCEAALASSSCSSQDLDGLLHFATCFSALAPCEYNRETRFSTAMFLCNGPVSSACATEFRKAELP